MPRLPYCPFHRGLASECGGVHGEAPRGVNSACPLDPAGEHQWEELRHEGSEKPLKTICALCGATK